MTNRPEPRNCQHEPPYPDHDTELVLFRYPDENFNESKNSMSEQICHRGGYHFTYNNRKFIAYRYADKFDDLMVEWTEQGIKELPEDISINSNSIEEIKEKLMKVINNK